MKVKAFALAPCLFLFAAAAWSYGGGGGSTSCAEPQFFTESPADRSTVDAFADFSFIASDTEPQSLSVKINGNPVPAAVTPMANGDLKVAIHLADPIAAPGRVQVAVNAKSKDGCFGFKAYYIAVKQ